MQPWKPMNAVEVDKFMSRFCDKCAHDALNGDFCDMLQEAVTDEIGSLFISRVNGEAVCGLFIYKEHGVNR